MLRALRYAYFVVYWWLRDRYGDGDAPHYSAFLALTFCLALNGGVVLMLLDLIGLGVADSAAWYPAGIAVIGGAIALGYMLFLRDRRFEAIIEDFGRSGAPPSRSDRLIVSLYVLASYLAFFVIGAIGTAQRAEGVARGVLN